MYLLSNYCRVFVVVASCLVLSSNGINSGRANIDEGYPLNRRTNPLWKLGSTNDDNVDVVRVNKFYPNTDNTINSTPNVNTNDQNSDSLSYLVQTVDRHNPDTLRELNQRVHRLLDNRPLQDRQTRNLEQKLYKVRLVGDEVNHHDWMNLRYNGEPGRFMRDMANYL